jgi:hypothetical protein
MKRIALAALLTIASLPSTALASNTCSGGVSNHGGTSIAHPRVHNIYIGEFWNTTGVSLRIEIDDAWQFLTAQPDFWSRLGEYGVEAGSWGDSAVTPATWIPAAGGSYDDNWFTGEITYAINDGQVADYNDGNDLYVVYLPQGVSSNYDIKNNADAHHLSFTDFYGNKIPYAIIDYGLSGYGIEVASHEIAEAATDPYDHGYWSSSLDEIADLCEGSATSPDHNFVWPGSSFVVQDIWSNDACTCIQTAIPTPVAPCAGLTGTARVCCEKPSLPVCNVR